jgi:hypothetical protein
VTGWAEAWRRARPSRSRPGQAVAVAETAGIVGGDEGPWPGSDAGVTGSSRERHGTATGSGRNRHRTQASSRRCRELRASARVGQQRPARGRLSVPYRGLRSTAPPRALIRGPKSDTGRKESWRSRRLRHRMGRGVASLARDADASPTSARACALIPTNPARPTSDCRGGRNNAPPPPPGPKTALHQRSSAHLTEATEFRR